MDNKQKHYFTTLQVPTWHKPPRFKESRRFDWINYGEGNDYPDYLINLYNGSSTHQAIVSGKKDYIFDVSGKARFLGCLAVQDNSVSENDNTSADKDKDVQ